MCTIVLLSRVHPEAPLVVAANRDEFYARGATPPQLLDERAGVVGGRDAEQGGTWMGVTRAGLFVGITNQRSYAGPRPGLRSRGEVAFAALRAGTVEGVRAHLEALDPAAYNSFNLVYGDGARLEVAYSRTEGTLQLDTLGSGVFVLANDRIGSPEFPKADRASKLATDALSGAWDRDREALRGLLSDHAMPPLSSVPEPPNESMFDHALVRKLQAICIHTPSYGTCSSTIAAVGDGRVSRYLFADGPPCTTAYGDLTTLASPSLAPARGTA